MPKKWKLLEKADLGFFLNYGLTTTMKIKYSVLFMLYIIFQVVTVKIREKEHTFSKTFFKVEIKPPDMKEMLLRLQLISW